MLRFSITRRAFLLLGLALAACASPAPRPVEEPLHLVILHTNDVHGQLAPRREEGGLRRLAARVNGVRAQLGPDEAVLVVDAGDWFQGTPEGRVDEGSAFVGLLAQVGYDAMAVGNHELDFGVEHFESLLDTHPVPAVCANVFDPATGSRVPWGAPWLIFERGGLRIAFVGLLSPETPSITHPSTRVLEFVDPVDALRDALEELEGQADVVIALTHLGLRDDSQLAIELDVPLIIGGHSHTWLEEGVYLEGSMIVQTGAKARRLGRVDLWIERSGPARGEVARIEAALLPLGEPADDALLPPGFGADCDALAAQAAADMDAVVGRLAQPLKRKGGLLASSTSGNLITDVFRARAGTPIAVHNKGGIRAALEAGPVTRRDLFELLPFDNTLVVLDVTGAELVEAVRRAVEEPEHSGIEVSGIRVRVAAPGEPKSPLIGVETEDGAPIDPEARYRVATNSFLADGGDGYFDDDVTVAIDTGFLLRELLEDALRDAGDGGLRPADDERFLAGK